MRKPTATVQVNLRIKERERRRLEAAAERNGVSMNAEIGARIARTFRETATLEIDQLLENARRSLGPLADAAHERAQIADLIHAADKLVGLVQPLLAIGLIDGPAGAEIRATIDNYILVKRAIDIEAGIRLRSARMPGAQS